MISNHDTADYILAQLLQDAPPHEDIWMQGEADEIPGFSTNVELMYSMLPSDTQFMDFDWELPHEIQESGAEATQAQPLAMVRTPYLAGPVTSTARPQSQLEVPPEPSHPQQPSQQQPSIPRSQPTPSSEEADTPASSCSNRGQNCLATLFQLALDLHVPSQSCTSDNTTSATSLDLDNTTAATPNNSSPIRGVDAVLLQNRAAAQSLSQILDCPCSKALSVTLAVYLVASKIVAWYGAIVGVESADHHHHHHHHHPSSLIERIVPSPIYMGAYSLGADVHRSVRANVVVSELGTLVEPMLAKLPHFHHALGNDCSNQLRWSSSSASSLSSLLSMESSSSSSWPIDGQACALRAQLRCIVDEANRPMCR